MEFTEIASPAIRQALEQACDQNGLLGFNQFVKIALYHPEFGYYRSRRERIGRSAATDFFTASSLKRAFGPILMEASVGILKKAGLDPAQVEWVEIGAEPEAALLDSIDSPFRSTRSVRVGEPMSLEGELVVFSNELFDAQPFHSVVFRGGNWAERLIEVSESGLRIVERAVVSPEIRPIVPQLPNPAPEGYVVDLPTGARAFTTEIAQQPWKGTFIALDYGKTWQALTHDTPQGTARAYQRHQQSNKLLEQIGQQDLTCHVCWDWLEDALAQHGFSPIELESQESFILKRAPQFLARVVNPDSQSDNPLKGLLRQLVHPSLMGQKFQALSAVRT